MKKETTRGIRLGIFVLAGTIFLVAALYLIGDKQNIFGNTFRVKAEFRDVNGLMPGNNVRFSGINVGTVESVEVLGGNSVTVVLLIEEHYKTIIRKNAVAAIGTDGLMGNKLVNISPGESATAPFISDGDVLATLQPVEMDEMVRTLSKTNDNMKQITDNLKTITGKINNSNSLWNFLSDTIVADDIRQTVVNVRLTSEHTSVLTGNLNQITNSIRYGKGTLGTLISDTTMAGNFRNSLFTIKNTAGKLSAATDTLTQLAGTVKNSHGAFEKIVMDTAFARSMNQSVLNLQSGTAGFDANMEALKHSFLLRGYFRKQEKNKTQNSGQK